MDKIFLDTNVYIDILENRSSDTISVLDNKLLYISALSVHIHLYIYKYKLPNRSLSKAISEFNIIEIDLGVTKQALEGPTDDFEDNLQLHSATKQDCNLFVSRDKKLLKMIYFGKMKIISPKEL
jgi:predicted nucleic acid-binding protein